MRLWGSRSRRPGFVTIEVLAVIAVIVILMMVGYSVYRSARLTARVVTAESNLKQVGVAMELYYGKYGRYPLPYVSLADELAEFLKDTSVLVNPLKDESFPGQTLTDYYRPPSQADIDSPGNYLTAFVADEPGTVVILKTGGVVERREITVNPNDMNTVLAVLSQDETPPGSGGETPPPGGETPPGTDTPPDGPSRLAGIINLNPRNNEDFEFVMQIPVGPPITRDELHASNGTLTYTGPALSIRFCPKGNGNQNGLTLDGRPCSVSNGRVYVIQGGVINVLRLWNDKKTGGGRAMGKWYIEIDATGATITEIH